ncbi:hypothetical protein M5K25_002665 [Dendrobium thyrsiflorum]|uniref:Xrn1 helical domain-containing protein n=1 Tax=Dendrobium thyrsiflorum TaxID=117978 RepID=A0ABD0VN51_DENTH
MNDSSSGLAVAPLVYQIYGVVDGCKLRRYWQMWLGGIVVLHELRLVFVLHWSKLSLSKAVLFVIAWLNLFTGNGFQAMENNEDLKLKTHRESCEDGLFVDKIKLGEPGYKERYYAEKFGEESVKSIEEVKKDLVQKYVEGLCWITRYYYYGVCSWQWFYPYHYAPFASDLNDLADLEITFFLGHPFKPLDQLMGTLPASSSEALPKRYGDLMTNPASPLNSFYPEDFEIDMNGKKFAWQGVAKLPFIDERRLLSETRKLEDSLTEEERFRNKIMFDIIYVNIYHPLAIQVASLYQMISQLGMQGAFQIKIDTTLSGGMNGFLCLTERNSYSSSVYNLNNNFVLNATYFNPLPHPHIPEPPKHVFFPAKILKPYDIKSFPVLWHEENGSSRQRARERPQVSGAISGLHLGEAAHRLVKNSLQIKANSAGLLDTPLNRKNSYSAGKTRPSGPLGLEGGFQNPNFDQHRHPHNSRDFSNMRNNFSIIEQFNPQDQYNIGRGMSQLSVQDGPRYRLQQRITPSTHQNIGPMPPPPPTNWIGNHSEQQQQLQSVQKVAYRIKQRPSQNLDYSNPQ